MQAQGVYYRGVSRSAKWRWKRRVLRRLNPIQSSNERSNHHLNNSPTDQFDYEPPNHSLEDIASQEIESPLESQPQESNVNNVIKQPEFINQQIFKEKRNESDDQLIDQVLDKLIHLHRTHKVKNCVMDEFLKIIRLVSTNKVQSSKLPVSFHQFKKRMDKKLKRYYGFECPFCRAKSPAEERVNKKFHCSNCDKYFSHLSISKKEYFFYFDLKQAIKLLLSKYSIKEPEFSQTSINSFFDSSTFRNLYSATNGQLIVISIFIDGAKVDSSSSKIWPIIVRVNNLDCSEDQRTFLLSCLSTTNKNPDPNFHIEFLIKQLIELYQTGIKINGKLIKVALFSIVFDTPARCLYLLNKYFNAAFGCTFCIDEGIRKKYVHLFFPNADFVRKSIDVHNEAWKRMSEQNFDSFCGITGRSLFFDLDYFDPTKGQSVELMHALGLGTIKRFFEFSTAFKNRNKKPYLSDSDVFDRRLMSFPINYDFKRKLLSTSTFHSAKANQCIQYFFL